MKLNIVTLVVLGFAFVLLGLNAWDFDWRAMRIAGLAVAAPSLVLFVLARIQLGSAFSVEAKATKLVTTGIYSKIRNPIYVFGGLVLGGVILMLQKPWFLLCLALLVPMQVIRSRKEERVLAAKFGEAYEEYKGKTWF
jgi:protein-S-isoprenylcysteine O-methyltransferase Ste14